MLPCARLFAGAAAIRNALDCAIVDVFAERPLAGNQLAVVLGAAKLDAASMRAIAREMNFSETTFVLAADANAARVRIFTPTAELPFSGHPTLGTAAVLRGDKRAFALDLAAGRVPVTFDDDGIAWMQPPAAELGAALDAAASAGLLGVSPALLSDAWPSRRAAIGPRFALNAASAAPQVLPKSASSCASDSKVEAVPRAEGIPAHLLPLRAARRALPRLHPLRAHLQ